MKRNTIQQRTVMETLERMLDLHPTANRIYDEIVQTMPSVSRATVYRILNQLAEDGVISRLAMPSSADRYDSRKEQHLHLGCSRCGRLDNLNMTPIEDAMKRIAGILTQTTGYNITRQQVDFVGICPDCQKADEENGQNFEQTVEQQEKADSEKKEE